MKGKRSRVFLKRAMVVTAILLVALAIAWPYACRYAGLPHNSIRLDQAVDDARLFAQALVDYRKEHGKLPESRWQLGQHIISDSRYGSERRLAAARLNQWQCFSQPALNQPTLARILFFRSKRVLVTVDGRGTVRASVVRAWPTWKL